MALKVTAGLVLLAIIGSVFWLTNDRTDLYQVIGVLSAITAIIGLTVTVLLAQKVGVSNFTRNRLAVAAFFISLIIPAAVAAIFALWWLVFGLVFAYWAYAKVYSHYIGTQPPTAEGRKRRWWVDRLTLETILLLIIFSVVLVIVIYFGTLTIGIIHLRPMDNVFILPTAVVCFALAYLCLRLYANRRAIPMLQAHIEPPIIFDNPHPTLMRRLRLASIYWMIWAFAATFATFMGQAWAYSWFISLLK